MSASVATKLTLPILSTPAVVLPGTVVTIALDSEASRLAVEAAQSSGGRVVLVPAFEVNATVGVIARVPNVGTLPNGVAAANLQADERVALGAEVLAERSGRWIEVTSLTESRPTPRVDALVRELRITLEEIAKLRNSRRLPEILRTTSEAGALVDAATTWGEAPTDHQLAILHAVDVAERVELALEWAKNLLAETQVTEQIRTDVTEGMEKHQREYLLRQQLAAIRKELGEGDDDEVGRYRAKVAALPLAEKVANFINGEIDRLERAGSQSPEHGWIRTWLDRVLEMPWGVTGEERFDLDEARAILDADHHGLDDVKDRIVEFLAVRKLRHERADSGPGAFESPRPATETEHPAPAGVGRSSTAERGNGAIVTLIGPPGVGKTSVGESIARAMGRPFVRVALGGIRDEAEIRGHRRTYVGAQPGRIVRAIAEAGAMNPVVLLDEVDKLSAGGWSGDPTAALLEVLDPAQNHTFRAHYLEVELDLSDVVFIATANVADTIPGPLLDRMELVRLDGYTADEKRHIARHHLLPRQVERNALHADEVALTDAAIDRVVVEYTREAGVRSLERELAKLLRKAAARVGRGVATPIVVDTPQVPDFLSRPKFLDDVAERVSIPGVATGLAVTGAGGDVLYIEVSTSDGEPGLTLTGQLGDVMKESAQIALSYVRSHAAELGITPEQLTRRFHVHVPAGAVPKDGPSAGITMTTAFVSALTNRTVIPTVGMTGEITLQGKVLPIGGVKQKVLAAHRSGLTTVVLPKRNGPDLEDVPAAVRDQMTFHLADTYDDVLKVAFESVTDAA